MDAAEMHIREQVVILQELAMVPAICAKRLPLPKADLGQSRAWTLSLLPLFNGASGSELVQ